MARLRRLAVAGQLHLVVQRAPHARPVFLDDEDARTYLRCLKDVATEVPVAIHAYSLLPGEVRLLATPQKSEDLGRLLQGVGRRYGPWYNRRHGRTGALWEGRFRGTVVDAAEYFVACLSFVEAAAVRAGLVQSANEYHWSSAAHHTGQRADPLITEHAEIWRLGNTPFEREARCRQILEPPLPPAVVARIEAAVLRGWTLGGDRFIEQLAVLTERRLRPLPRGRPKISDAEPNRSVPIKANVGQRLK